MNNYLQAARVLDGVLSRKGSIKTLALRSDIQNKRFVTALVSETLRYKAALDQILDSSGLRPTLRKEVRDPHLLYLLLFDLLFGKGIQGGGQVKRLLKAHESALRQAAEGVEAPPPQTPRGGAGGEGDEDDGGGRFPRYARVNPLKTTVAAAVAALVGGGGGGKQKGREEGEEEGKAAADAVVLAAEDVQEDPHIPGLLALPPGTDLHAHPLVASGALVLQDKASCFSAQALLGDVVTEAQAAGGGTPGRPFPAVGDVIDACAAPGNKTSHAAALLHAIANAGGATKKKGKGNSGGGVKSKARVFALDRDAKRLAILKRRVGDGEKGGMGYGPQLVVPLCEDFLRLDPADPRMGKVRAILLDPSCSGSGMVASLERTVALGGDHHHHKARGGQKGKGGKEEAEAGRNWRAGVKDGGPTARLKALAQFQFKALTKAFSFPQVERVVYSTCSLHAEEDEMVVAAALRSEVEKGEEGGSYRPFELRPALPSWLRRGLVETPDGRATGLTAAQAACVVRTDPREDRTNGFFVARFERRGGGGVLLHANPSAAVAGGGKGAKKGKKRVREEGEEEEAAATVPSTGEEAGPAAAGEDEGDGDGGGGGGGDGVGPSRAQRRRERRKKIKQMKLGGEVGAAAGGGGEND